MTPDRQPTASPPPRQLPHRFAYRRAPVLWIVGIVFIAVGISLSILFAVLGIWFSPFGDWTLDRRHETTTATVTKVELRTSIHHNNDHPWQIDFRFQLDGGATYASSGYCWDRATENLRPEDKIQIQYDPEKPSRARPANGSIAPLPPWFFFMILALIGHMPFTGAICLLIAARRARRDRDIYIHGEAATAQILSVRKISYVNIGSNSPYDVRYQFLDAMDNLVNGREWSYAYDWAARLTRGDTVTVLYAPRRPSQSMLWVPPDEPDPIL